MITRALGIDRSANTGAEDSYVDLVRRHLERIARRYGAERFGQPCKREAAANARRDLLDRAPHAARWILAPQQERHPVERDRTRRLEREDREEAARQRAPEPDRTRWSHQRDRPQDPNRGF